MSLIQLLKNIIPYVKPYKWLVILTLILTLIDSDMIFAMKNGRVVEYGTHEEAYHQGGTYKEIFDAAARSLNVEKINDTIEGVE